jgi:hypothetical protein
MKQAAALETIAAGTKSQQRTILSGTEEIYSNIQVIFIGILVNLTLDEKVAN